MEPLDIPLVRQSYSYSCGAACLASILYYWGVWEGREPELYEMCKTTEYGTSGYKIVETAKYFKLDAHCEKNMNIEQLRKLFSDGYTVMLSIQAWGNYTDDVDWSQIWDDGHYVILVGIKDDDVYVMDPSLAGRYGIISIEQLEQRWHEWSDDEDAHQEFHSAIIINGVTPAGRRAPTRIL